MNGFSLSHRVGGANFASYEVLVEFFFPPGLTPRRYDCRKGESRVRIGKEIAWHFVEGTVCRTWRWGRRLLYLREILHD